MKPTFLGKIIEYIVPVLILLGVGVVGGWLLYGSLSAPKPAEPTMPEAALVAPALEVPAPVPPTPASTPNLPATTVEWHTLVPLADLKLLSGAEYFSAGTVKQGPYKGGKLILAQGYYEMGGPSHFRFIQTIGLNYILLTRYSDEVYPEYDDKGQPIKVSRKAYEVDKTFTIPELDYPETLFGPAGKEQKLLRQEYVRAIFDAKDYNKLFADPVWGDVYIDKEPLPDSFVQNGFYLNAPDSTLKTYALEFPFMGKERIPAITWNDKTKNTTEYVSTEVTGCGSSNYAAVIRGELDTEKDLVVAGKLSNGEIVYELKDPNNPFLKPIYEFYGGQFKNGSGEYEKMPFEKFIKMHPIFFWKDSFGRFIKFQNAQFIPMAECGKPVIYLYPEKTAKVSVKLTPRGGFTYTEPEYKDGWSVVAHPNGQLVETVSGKTYPYLFWEGRGGIYEQPKKGFSVRREDVSSFLDTSLTALGLQGKEITDFKEFWLPRMQNAPYYFVTFIGTKGMDEIAPLEVTPKPDTVIRVLMDFSPLAAPVKVEPVKLGKIPRKGFTVIEWGGVINK